MEKSVLEKLSEEIRKTSIIDNERYLKYEVKRDLRDISGKGTLAGLTEIDEARGIDINEIIEGFLKVLSGRQL